MITPIQATVVRTPIQPRFSDFDALGHLNNAKYLEYVEVARVHTFAEILGVDLQEISAVMGNATISFLRPIRLFENLALETAITDVRERSIDIRINFRVGNGEDSPRAIVDARQIIVDARNGKAHPVPKDLTNRITQLIAGDYQHEAVREATIL